MLDNKTRVLKIWGKVRALTNPDKLPHTLLYGWWWLWELAWTWWSACWATVHYHTTSNGCLASCLAVRVDLFLLSHRPPGNLLKLCCKMFLKHNTILFYFIQICTYFHTIQSHIFRHSFVLFIPIVRNHFVNIL